MTPERWRQIETLFNAAADRAIEARSAYLDQACRGDWELRQEVESLLDKENPEGAFLATLILDATDSISVTDAEDFIGKRIGAYRVTDLIGEGGMGTVLRAARDDDQYQKEVAIKLVKPGMGTGFVLRRFRHERQILANLEHPYIARLLEGGTTGDGQPYLVMEFVEGLPIAQYCEEKALSLPDRLNLFRAVCSAVQYAHQNLVIHRDLKPSNILVMDDGTPKLLDFGIAKLLEPQNDSPSATQTLTGMRIMTPDYASPEQARGEQVTTATDVYSLGVVFYELLTGQRPYQFAKLTPSEIERVICQTQPQRPSDAVAKKTSAKWRRQLSGDLDNIALMAMRKEPERRYQSAEQFSDDIRRHLSGLPVRARHDTVGYRARKFITRHKLGVAATLLVAFSLVGGVVATSYQARRAERRFQQVRKLANTFLFDVHDQIQNLPGSTEARETVVETALEYLNSLSKEAAGDPALEWELAVAYQKVGDVQGDPWVANLGHTEAAMESYRKSLNLAEKLAANDPGNELMQQTLAQNYFKLGMLLSATGNKIGAQKTLRQGVGLAELLAERTGGSKDIALVENYHIRIGDTQLDTGDAAGSLVSYHHVLQLSERRAANFPSDDTQMSLAFSHSHVGEAQAALGDITAAIESYKQSLTILEAISKKQPSNTGYRRGVRIAYIWLGKLSGHPRSINLGNRAKALEYYRKALAIAEELAATDQKNVRFRIDLAISYQDVADMLSGDDPAQAIALYRRTLAITRSLLEIAPNEFRYLRRQAVCSIGLATALERLGDEQGARQNLLSAMELLHQLSARDSADVEIQADIHFARQARARLVARTGDETGAQEHHRQAIAAAEKAVAAMPAHLYSQWQLADSYAGLGNFHSTLGADARRPTAERSANWREAHAWYQKSLGVWDRWNQHAVSTVFNTSRRDEIARTIAQSEAALNALK